MTQNNQDNQVSINKNDFDKVSVIRCLLNFKYKKNEEESCERFDRFEFRVDPKVTLGGVLNRADVYEDKVDIHVQQRFAFNQLKNMKEIKDVIFKSLQTQTKFNYFEFTFNTSFKVLYPQIEVTVKYRVETYFDLLDEIYIIKFKSSNVHGLEPSGIMMHAKNREDTFGMFKNQFEEVAKQYICDRLREGKSIYDITCC